MLKDLLSRWPLIQQIQTGADGTGPVGGFGTSYISGKIALLTEPEVKVAVSPILLAT